MLDRIFLKWRIFSKNKGAMVGLAFLLFLFFLILFIIVGQFFNLTFIFKLDEKFPALQYPSWKHWMGTGAHGNDLFVQIILGFAISFGISLSSVIICLIGGLFFGILAGYLRNLFENISNFICDILLIFPSIIVVILMIQILGNNVFNLIIILSIFYIVIFIKVIKAKVVEIREKDFIKTTRSLGASHSRIIFKHILPNLIPTLIMLANNTVCQMIILIASLAVMGLGLNSKVPELGLVLEQGKHFMTEGNHYYIIIFPLLILFLSSLAFYLIGDGLSDMFDPKKQNI